MALCEKCGCEIIDGEKLCETCKAKTEETVKNDDVKIGEPEIETVEMPIEQTAKVPHCEIAIEADAEQNKAMAILSYIGILVLIPIIVAPKSLFAKFHMNQGLILFVMEAVYILAAAIINAICFSVSWWLGSIVSSLLGLISIIFLLLSLVGIVNAASAKKKELPLIGGIKLLK